jgi:hypothetical protein
VTAAFEEGDSAEVDFEAAQVRNRRTGQACRGTPGPRMLLDILTAGGIIARLQPENLLLEETR